MTQVPPDFHARLLKAQQSFAETIRGVTITYDVKALIRKGWKVTYATLFGQSFVDVLAPHHIEAIEWHWESRIAFLENRRPEYLAYFPIWSRGHMKCVDENVEVLMGDGSRKRIKDVRKGEPVQSWDECTGKMVVKPITNKWHAGRKKCVTLKTRSGWELTATPDHKVRTFNGWKRVGDLLPDDRIASPRRTTPAQQESEASAEEVRLLTYFLAEGNTTASGNGIGCAANITNADDVVVDDAIACASILGFAGKRSRAKFRVTFTNGVRDWLRRHGIARKKATEKRLPTWFYGLSESQIKMALAAWLDTDGFISTQSAGINLANEGLIDDLRYLCLQMGIVTKKYHLVRDGFESWVIEFDHHNIQRLRDLPLRLKQGHWESLCSTSRYSLIDCYPQSITQNLPKGLNRQLRREVGWKPSYSNPRVTRDKIQRGLTAHPLPLWEWLENADVFWDEVESVTDVGIRDTYDIEVKDTHNFIANGLVTHNSTVAERMVVVDAILSAAHGQPGFCLYVGREKTKVKDYIGNIERLLSSPQVKKYCPELSEVAQNEETNQKRQWTAIYLSTKANYTVKGGTVESAQAGSRVDKTRPTFIVPDDIDGREDSVVTSETRLRKLTGEILPMRQNNTLVYFAQNLISRYSVMYRIQSGREKVLTNRKPSEPVPAVRNLVTEERVVDGIVKDVFVSGESTWQYWDAQRIQDEIDTEGLAAFLRECQHEVQVSNEGRVHKRYDDEVHAISWSQFNVVYGEDAWKSWFKVPFSDWSRTKTKYHANVAGYLAVSSAMTPHPGITFCIPYSFPADTAPEDVAVRFLDALSPYAYGSTTWKQLVDDAWKRVGAENHFTNVADRLEYAKNYYKAVIPQYARQVLGAHNVRTGAMSHSEDKVRDMFNMGFGFSFVASNPSKTDALEDIDAAQRVDYNSDHLFKEGKGYSRWYVICKDDFAQEPTFVDGMAVYPPVPFPDVLSPDALHDDDLFRYQMINRRFAAPKLTEKGELIDDMLKLDDDFGQGLQMVYFKKLLANISMTKMEKFAASVPAHLQEQNLSTPNQWMAREMYVMKEIEKLKKKQESNEYDWEGSR